MSNGDRPGIGEDATSEPAHPAPAQQSPRPLGDDGLPQRHDLTEERVQRQGDSQERNDPKTS